MLRLFNFKREYSTANKVVELIELAGAAEIISKNKVKNDQRDLMSVSMKFTQKMRLKVIIGDLLKKHLGNHVYVNYQMLSENEKLELRNQMASIFTSILKSASNEFTDLTIEYANVYENNEQAIFHFPEELIKIEYMDSHSGDSLKLIREKILSRNIQPDITNDML
jgi:hypothetical protein